MHDNSQQGTPANRLERISKNRRPMRQQEIPNNEKNAGDEYTFSYYARQVCVNAKKNFNSPCTPGAKLFFHFSSKLKHM